MAASSATLVVRSSGIQSQYENLTLAAFTRDAAPRCGKNVGRRRRFSTAERDDRAVEAPSLSGRDPEAGEILGMLLIRHWTAHIAEPLSHHSPSILVVASFGVAAAAMTLHHSTRVDYGITVRLFPRVYKVHAKLHLGRSPA